MSGPALQPLAGFEAGYSFYTMNVLYEILRMLFVVKNLETTVYTISFVISQMFENDRRIARPLRLCKQASTALVSVQPVSELTNCCPVSTSSAIRPKELG